MFHWYEKESGEQFEAGVIERIFYEINGQPGLICWMGELLTQNEQRPKPVIPMQYFEQTYTAACQLLPNNNVLNLISKAKQVPYKGLVFIEAVDNDNRRKYEQPYSDPATNVIVRPVFVVIGQ